MYIIHYIGIFQQGYVKHTLWKKSKEVPIQTHDEGIDFASKYRFKFIADLFCRLHNWESERNFELRTYKVIKLNESDVSIHRR